MSTAAVMASKPGYRPTDDEPFMNERQLDYFKKKLLADGNTAVAEMGLEVPGLKLVVLENTARLHHLVVCTLCSCYPRTILGVPPLWYKSRDWGADRQRTGIRRSGHHRPRPAGPALTRRRAGVVQRLATRTCALVAVE